MLAAFGDPCYTGGGYPTMDFESAPSPGRWIGSVAVALLLVTEIGLLVLLRRTGPGPMAALLALSAFALFVAIARLVYPLWGLFSLRYRVARDGIAIRWASTTQIIPMQAITHILSGRPYAGRLRGLRWPGQEVGRTAVATDDGQIRPTLVYATTGPESQLLIVTPDLAYAISPADRAAFLAEFQTRRRLGPVQSLRQETAHAPWLGLSLWQDGLTVRLLATALLLVALATAWLLWNYPNLPSRLNLALRPGGVEPAAPASLRSRDQLWSLPLLAAAATIFNGIVAGAVHRRARIAATLLAAGALAVAASLWLVLARIVVWPP